jgi:hypothetical protein
MSDIKRIDTNAYVTVQGQYAVTMTTTSNRIIREATTQNEGQRLVLLFMIIRLVVTNYK